MKGIVCDRCGEGLLIHENVRYTMKVEIRSEYDPLEITQADLEQDLDAEFEKALRELEDVSEQEADRSVYFAGRYDLCLACQKAFLEDPVFNQ